MKREREVQNSDRRELVRWIIMRVKLEMQKCPLRKNDHILKYVL